jgi:hypothetical protein
VTDDSAGLEGAIVVLEEEEEEEEERRARRRLETERIRLLTTSMFV